MSPCRAHEPGEGRVRLKPAASCALGPAGLVALSWFKPPGYIFGYFYMLVLRPGSISAINYTRQRVLHLIRCSGMLAWL